MEVLATERHVVLEDWEVDILGEQYILQNLLDEGNPGNNLRAIARRLKLLKRRLLAVKMLMKSLEKEGH